MSKTNKSKKDSIPKATKKIDWHYGIYCALKHDLRDFEDVLSYERERPIGNN